MTDDQTAIEFRDVSFTLPDGRTLLSNLSLRVQSGETLVLLGRSGSGKTTTMKLINRLIDPTAGELRVEGKPTIEWDPIRLRRRIGYVIQEIGLFPHLTVEENIGVVPRLEGWAPERIRQRARALLTMVGLDADRFAARFPRELSGGQRQRIGVARALAADPPVILLDEDDGDRLAHHELLMLAAVLLTAGTDTTRNQLAASLQVLCEHPDQWALLAAHPELAMNAVEETMRHSPVVFGAMRVATEDVQLGGVVIPAGTLVGANTGAANRDPDIYEQPDRLNITRNAAPAMLTFGGGVHYCLGSHLARLELAEALTVITRRMPNPRRTGPAPWKPLTGMSGPRKLLIEFDAGR